MNLQQLHKLANMYDISLMQVDPVDEKTLIAVANWNDIPDKVSKVIEASEYVQDIEYDDECSECSECYRYIRTEPDSYFWQPEFIATDLGIFCNHCVDSHTIVEQFVNNPRKCVTGELVNKIPEDFVQTDTVYESGWFDGQNADPSKVFDQYKDRNDVIFVKIEQSQFYSKWGVRLRPKFKTLRVVYHFDVWGNATEGYEVNDSRVEDPIDVPVNDDYLEEFIRDKLGLPPGAEFYWHDEYTCDIDADDGRQLYSLSPKD